jgi:molecular chaperone GrpE
VTSPFGGRSSDRDPDEQPIIHDRRRVDPETGKLREGASPPDPAEEAAAASLADDDLTADGLASAEIDRLQTLADERTADLQRLQAEYVNYRRRVDRDRLTAGELATAKAVTELLPVLDDVARAEQHGELTGGFKAVADSLLRTLDRLGVTRYGEVGDPFDPTVHEALMHQVSDDVDGPTATAILQPGYRLGERILRPARVTVSEPSHGGWTTPPGADGPGETGTADQG